MAEVQQVWGEVLPEIRNAVTGVGVWAALNSCTPVTVSADTLVMGLPHGQSELAGHLRLAATKTLIERKMSERLGTSLKLRVIEGVTMEDWALVQRRDAEAERLQQQALSRMQAEVAARSTWDSTYEKLSRIYAAIPNKSMPQNRAKFLKEALELLVHARKDIQVNDDLGERNYARCLERVAQYAEIPSALVATWVAEKLGE